MRRAVAAATVAMLGAVAPPSAFGAQAARPPTGDEIVRDLAAGRVSRIGTTIRGDLDFTKLGVVRHAFSCRECHVQGEIRGDDVVFEATFELSGVQVDGAVVMRRATFRGPAVFGPTVGALGGSEFSGSVDLSLATFEDLVSFQHATFADAAIFSGVRFGAEAVFTFGRFSDVAAFDSAIFRDDADFRRRSFGGTATFDVAEFEGRAEFGASRFASEVTFSEARFRDASFVGSVFDYQGREPYGVTFADASATGDLRFDLARFRDAVNLRRTAVGHALSFEDVILAVPPRSLVFGDASAGVFSMDVDEALDAVQPADREHVLELIEAGAKATGDLGVANDARYSLEVLASRKQSWGGHAVNVVFYRWVAGYFVRWRRPIAALLVLAAAISLARALTSDGVGAAGRSFQRAWTAVRTWGHEFLDALALVAPGAKTADGRHGRRLEALTYRVLFVIALICLANSNPTLREMFDAVV